jgi:hypothetical protein
MVIKMTVRSVAYETLGKMNEYLPNILHAAGAVLSIVSGIPSLPNNPPYPLNLSVGYILGKEAEVPKPPRDFPPTTKYDGMAGAFRGFTNSRNVKAAVGVGLGAMSVWFAAQGHMRPAAENALFDLGIWFSVAGSEIERRRMTKELKELEEGLDV